MTFLIDVIISLLEAIVRAGALTNSFFIWHEPEQNKAVKDWLEQQ